MANRCTGCFGARSPSPWRALLSRLLPRLLLLLLLLLHALLDCRNCVVAAQPSFETWPFTGQGSLPSGSAVVVNVSLHLEKVMSIEESRQSWQAIHWVHLRWEDGSAMHAVRTATERWAAAVASRDPTAQGCTRACDSSYQVNTACCDDLWLPQVELPNLVAYEYETNQPKWRIWLTPDASKASGFVVNWSVRIVGTWASALDYRAWPLEHQHLLVEMQPAGSIADQVALHFASFERIESTAHTKGTRLLGWYIADTTARWFDTSACYLKANTTTYQMAVDLQTGTALWEAKQVLASHLLDPGHDNIETTVVAPGDCSAGNIEANAQYSPHVLVFDMMVKRNRFSHVIIYIVPLIIIDLMVFVVYAMDTTDLEHRIQVIVTLVLAICALQFMYTFPPAEYLNAVQQLTLMSFALMLVVAVQCMVTSSIPRQFERQRRLRDVREAAGVCDAVQPSQQSLPERLATFLHHVRMGGDANLGADGAQKPLRTSSSTLVCGLERDPEAGDNEGVPEQDHNTEHSSAPVQSEADMERPAHRASPDATADAQADASGPAGCSERPSLNQLFVRFSRPFAEGGMQGDATVQRAKAVLLSGLREMKETRKKMHRDEAYAILVARKVDLWSCWILLFLFLAVTIILVVLASAIGDHRLMLVGMTMPGNA